MPLGRDYGWSPVLCNNSLATIPLLYADAVAQMAQIVQAAKDIKSPKVLGLSGANSANWLKSQTRAIKFPDGFFPHVPLN
jgi:hypothetical protein